MTMLQHGLVPSTGGYQIERSLRFNSADTAYLSRTPASAGNRKTWTWSGWVKISKESSISYTYVFTGNSATSDSGFTGLGFVNASTNLFVTGWNTNWRITTQVFRDFSAWYHIVVALDTTQATANDRIKVYVNGTQVTDFSTTNNPTQNADLGVNTAAVHYLSSYNASASLFDGYLTEVNFIDGSALTPSSFGETDTDTGVWKPKAYSGSYGTNGFYLKFADNSGTTSTTLGKDSSGNGNNWTPNNFSVTAGAGNDSLVDTPTQYGTDTGAGGEVRGNYCTLNPLAAAGGPLANGNLDIASSGYAGLSSIYGTIGVSSGKWYWEVTAQNALIVGVGSAALTGAYPGQSGISCGWNVFFGIDSAAYVSGGITNNVSTGTGSAASAGDVIGVALDMDAGTLYLYRNGTILNSGNAVFTTITGSMMPAFRGPDTNTSVVNFGQRPFAHTPRSGHKALCTQNLPTPTIGATATTRADDYFNTVLYTGNATSRSISGVGFQPDFVWIKDRSSASWNHVVFDAVRGATYRLLPNITNAEDTGAGYGVVTSFNSDGFSIDTGGNVNNNGDAFVAWNWKATGAGSSNTQGTITSTVSANTTAGFSVVTWTADGSNSNGVGHGLGVTPTFIIYKKRSPNDGVAMGWYVWTTVIDGSNDELVLNTTAAKGDVAAGYGSPTSTTISNYGYPNGNSLVAYCFAPVAGYSAFGSYTGNGSTDGVFVYTGMRPKFILIKASSTTSYWVIFDVARNTYNVMTSQLWPNVSDAENNTYGVLDAVSNGFKLRNTAAGYNDNGVTYIYMAVAENPFKYSLAR